MANTTRRGKPERDHICDKKAGTGSYKLRKKSPKTKYSKLKKD